VRTSSLAIFSAFSLASAALCAPAPAGGRPGAVGAQLARSEAALAAIASDPYAPTLGAELAIARRHLADANRALETRRPRRARALAPLVEAQIGRLRSMLSTAAADARARVARAEVFLASAALQREAGARDRAVLAQRGAQLSSAFPALEGGPAEDEEIERVIAASRRRAAADEAAAGEDPRLREARAAIGREEIARARREVEMLGVLAADGAALEEQRSSAQRAVAEAEAALSRGDYDGVQRATERVTGPLRRALTWAFEVGGDAAAARRAAVAKDIEAAGLAAIADDLGVHLAENR
jgi:hypothetical protein